MSSRSLTAMILAFLVPGGGHVYLGRRNRGLAFLAIILLMFIAGLLLEGKVYVARPGSVLSLLATLGSMGAGLPYFVARLFGATGDITSITYEYGTAFTLTAGIMNLLLVLDSFDIAEGRKS